MMKDFMKDFVDDKDPVKVSIEKLKSISAKVGERYKEDISEIISTLKEVAGIEGEDEMEEVDEEMGPKKGIIIASLKKKFSPEEEYED